jgi:molecular chaperone GrpE
MKDHKKRSHHDPREPKPDVVDAIEAAIEGRPVADPAPAAGAVVEPADQAIMRLEEEVAALKDQRLRLAAEFDNFRKRAAKERAEVWEKAQADLVLRLVDALDDLTRFGRTPASDAKQLQEGVGLIERKLWKELSGLGVARVDEVGVPFDPNLHEAVTTSPAPSADQDHTVGAVLQTGYKLGKQLLRPARVQVLTWSGDGAQH